MENKTGRLEALSDGIFGVALTLLALNIDIKATPGEAVTSPLFWEKIRQLWPQYFAYFNSFAAVLLMWMSHHRIFKLIGEASTAILFANGLLLLLVALMPFPTNCVGEFIGTGAHAGSIIFYTGYSVAVAASYCVLCMAAKGTIHRAAGAAEWVELNSIFKGLLTGVLLNALILLVAFFAPNVAMGLNFCMWIFWGFASHRSERGQSWRERREKIFERSP